MKEYLEKIFKKTGWFSILESVIFAILGAILIWKPEGTVKVISYILGIIFIVAGLYKIIHYLSTKGKYDFYNYDLIYGLLACILGIVTIIYSTTIGSIFRIIIGIWIIYSSLIRLSASMKLRTITSRMWIYSLVLAIAMLICGLYVTLNAGAIVVTIGAMMIVYSVIDIIEDIIFMRNVKETFGK
ncbi:MAG: DUF308 domain-containing protein [Clostridia bacterium]|nr:DUF308 domain-containing protein [Clostridia bacterium]